MSLVIDRNSKLFVPLIAVLTAISPFAIDTYAPSIDIIARYFDIDPSRVLFTFTTYFIGFSIGILFWGPVSDEYGRKRVITLGLLIHILVSILCAVVDYAFWQLSFFRLIQGFGNACGITVGVAILRDCYTGKKLTRSMATLSMVVMVALIVAPIIGAILANIFSNWQCIFYFLAFYGVGLLICNFFLEETHSRVNEKQKDEHHKNSQILKSIKNYKLHFKNSRYIYLSIINSLFFCAFFSFIGSSAVIYINIYGTSKYFYSFLMALNISAILVANIMLKLLINRIDLFVLKVLAASAALTGIMLALACSHTSTYLNGLLLFFIFMFIATFGISLFSTLIMGDALNSVTHSFGTAFAIGNGLRFGLAGLVSYTMSFFSGYSLLIMLPVQQIILVEIALILFIIVIRHELKERSSKVSV